MLEISGLAAAVNGQQILNGIDLVVPSGEVHAIMGPNGSGKSTLAYVLAGREGYEVTAGSVRFEGRDLLALPRKSALLPGYFWRSNIRWNCRVSAMRIFCARP